MTCTCVKRENKFKYNTIIFGLSSAYEFLTLKREYNR